MNIQELSNGVVDELKTRGYAEKTVSITQRILSQIIRWFDDKNDGKITKEYVELYLHELTIRFNTGNISKSYYTQFRCAINRLCEYVETGYVSLTPLVVAQGVQPSRRAATLIESVLAATSLNENFKHKMRGVLRRFFCFIEDKGLCEQDINRDVMVSYIHHCNDFSSGYMAYIVRSLRILSEYLVMRGKMQNAPDFRFITPKHSPHKLVSPYTEQELSAVISAIDKSTATGKHDYAIILLAVGTGLRSGDIVKLKLTDIDWKSQTIGIVQSKTGKAIKISISGQICNAIAEYILNGRPKAYVSNVFLRERAPFVAFRRGGALGLIIDRLCEKAKIEKKPRRSIFSKKLREIVSTLNG